MILVKNLKFLPSFFVCLYAFIGLDKPFDDVLDKKNASWVVKMSFSHSQKISFLANQSDYGQVFLILLCVCFSLNQAFFFFYNFSKGITH